MQQMRTARARMPQQDQANHTTSREDPAAAAATSGAKED